MISSVSYDDYILFSENMQKTQASFAKFSQHDAEIYPAFDAYLQEATKVVRSLLWETPIDPSQGRLEEFRSRRPCCGSIARSGGRCIALSIC